jgi:hypothetical protein
MLNVIPAEAGISGVTSNSWDPGLRRDDARRALR